MSVDQRRGLGLRMGTRYAPHQHEDEDENIVTTQRYLSWTTDEAKADAARELGATCVWYESTDPRFSGWEVTVNEILP